MHGTNNVQILTNHIKLHDINLSNEVCHAAQVHLIMALLMVRLRMRLMVPIYSTPNFTLQLGLN